LTMAMMGDAEAAEVAGGSLEKIGMPQSGSEVLALAGERGNPWMHIKTHKHTHNYNNTL